MVDDAQLLPQVVAPIPDSNTGAPFNLEVARFSQYTMNACKKLKFCTFSKKLHKSKTL